MISHPFAKLCPQRTVVRKQICAVHIVVWIQLNVKKDFEDPLLE